MSPAPGGKSRPLGFLLLVLGLGIRMDASMDSSWGVIAWLLIVAGAVTAGVGLWALGQVGMRESFVPRRAGE